MTPQVSVLIPIYNVHRYIERCAHSLMQQTFDDVEYIFIDDDTPDDSVQILESVIAQYPDRAKSIRIIHHPQNLGLAAARNSALDVAQGKYICWCDSDDWIEPDYCSSLYQEAERTNADIVVCDFIHEYQGWSSVERFQEFSSYQLLLDNRKPYCWNLFCRFVRRSLLEDNGLRSFPNIDMLEDVGLAVRFHYFSHHTVYLHRALYHYNRINPTSIINQNENPATGKQAIYELQCKECMQRLTDFLEDRQVSPLILRQKIQMVIIDSVLSSGQLHRLDYSYRKYIPFFMRRTEYSLGYRMVVSCAMLGFLIPLKVYRLFSFLRNT